MTMFVHVRWVGGSSNVHVDILSIHQIKNVKFLVASSPLVMNQKYNIFLNPLISTS